MAEKADEFGNKAAEFDPTVMVPDELKPAPKATEKSVKVTVRPLTARIGLAAEPTVTDALLLIEPLPSEKPAVVRVKLLRLPEMPNSGEFT